MNDEFVRNNSKKLTDRSSIVMTGLPPVVDERTQVLIPGSMPGSMSIRTREYYANPQNRFWRIVQDVFGVPSSESYSERLDALKSNGVGLWDVLKHCERVGSLDASIIPATEIANDFEARFRTNSQVERVVFNGKKAMRSFLEAVLSSMEK